MKISSEEVKRVQAFGRELSRENNVLEIERIAGMFPRGFISIVASMAGTGKTWFTEYVACQLSVGGSILGGLVSRSKKMKCVIMAGETGTDLLNYRLSQTPWQYDSSRIRAYNAVEMMLEGMPCMINTPEGQRTITTIFAVEKPDIVFFDTLISFHSADESKQNEMTLVYTFLLRLAKAVNCAIVINHHTRKRPANFTGKKFTQDDIIGSSAGVRLCATAYIIMAENDDNGGSKMTVSNPKNWDKKTPDFSYKFVETDEGLTDFEVSFDTGGRNLFWSIREKLANLIKNLEAGAVLTVPNVAKELGVSSENLRYYMEEAAKKGQLTKSRMMNETTYTVMKK